MAIKQDRKYTKFKGQVLKGQLIVRCLGSEEMLFQVGALWRLFCVEVNTVGSWNWEEGSGGMRGDGGS